MFGITRARRLGTLVRGLTEVPRHFRSPEYVLQTIPSRLVATGRQRKKEKEKKEGVLVISFIRYPPVGHCGSYLLDLLFYIYFFK